MQNRLSIYIHIPFCKRKCLYCDFLSFPAGENVQEQYVSRLLAEIREEAAAYRGYVVDTIFLGGGTPSLLPAEAIVRILDMVRENFRLCRDAEVSMEVNPGTAASSDFAAYRKAGINRLSIGLQSAQEEELRILGRIHSYQDFCGCFQQARAAGFSNLNVDLMIGLPGQGLRAALGTAEKVLALEPEHLSVYSLIVEEGTVFAEYFGESDVNGGDILHEPDGQEERNGNCLDGQGFQKNGGADYLLGQGSQKNGSAEYLQGQGCQKTCSGNQKYPALAGLRLPAEDLERQMYYEVRSLLKKNGYHQYEISNFAREGYECAHNRGYWTDHDYAGFGLGAASKIGDARWKNTEDIEKYLTEKEIRSEWQKLSQKDQMEEFMFLGLRLTEGVSPALFQERFGHPVAQVYGGWLQEMTENGLLERADGRIFLSERGMDLANFVMSGFLID